MVQLDSLHIIMCSDCLPLLWVPKQGVLLPGAWLGMSLLKIVFINIASCKLLLIIILDMVHLSETLAMCLVLTHDRYLYWRWYSYPHVAAALLA
jgi:hypothetical protein